MIVKLQPFLVFIFRSALRKVSSKLINASIERIFTTLILIIGKEKHFNFYPQLLSNKIASLMIEF